MEQLTEQERMLWKQAKKRVAFRRHLFSYIIINGFVWALWFFGRFHDGLDMAYTGPVHHFHFPWPMYMTLGWGIGLAFSFYGAYIDNKHTAVQREFEKLKNK